MTDWDILPFPGHESYPSLIRQNALNNNMGNPRLPPYPHPTTLHPLAQIKLSPLGLPTVATTGGRTPGSPQTAGNVDHVCCVAACFAAPRGWVAGSPNLSVERRGMCKIYHWFRCSFIIFMPHSVKFNNDRHDFVCCNSAWMDVHISYPWCWLQV